MPDRSGQKLTGVISASVLLRQTEAVCRRAPDVVLGLSGGVDSGVAAELLVPALPYLLGFAAGAMLYVVVEEMIPEMSQGRHSHIGVLAFAAGFSVMMVLDVALG